MRVVVVTGFTHQFGLVVVVVIGWVVVIHAASPGVRLVTEEALQVPVDDTSLTTTEVCSPGVKGLLMRSFFTDIDTSAFGVTVQVQHASSSSAGSKT